MTEALTLLAVSEAGAVTALIGAVLGSGISGAVAMLIRTRADREPAYVTSVGQVAAAQDALIENLREEVSRLEDGLRRRDARIERQQVEIESLEKRIVALEVDPPDHLG